MANNFQPITLPAAAEQAAHDLSGQFVFSETNALGLAWSAEPTDNVPPQAEDHVPPIISPEGGLGISTGLVDTVPPQAEDHVPSVIPPDGSQSALDHVSETGAAQLSEQVDWLNTGDQFTFSTADAIIQSSSQLPLEHVPEQAEDHVPSDIPTDGLPQAADNMSDTAKGQLSEHVDWLNAGDQLTFSATDAPSQSSNAALEHVPEQAAGHVPTDIPPNGLPQVALDNMSDTAKEQLADHVDWLISGDQLTFSNTDAPTQISSEPPLEHIPEQAEDHVPLDIPPDDLPETAVDHMPEAAVVQLNDHVDWLIS